MDESTTELAHSSMTATEEDTSSGVNRLTQDLRQLKGDAKQVATENLSKAEDALRDYVHAQPIKTLMIAFGAGALWGLLIRR